MDTVSMLNKMSFYCQPILPLVYDESMSYYETLCKVVGQLNTTGETVNKLNEGLTGEISDRQAADAELDERLTGEISDRRTADAALNDKLTGEIADRYNADSLLNERLKVVEATNKKIHFLAFAGTPPHNARPVGAMPTRSELRQWINDRDMIVTVMETTDKEHNLVYATSCTYNAVNWTHETPAGFYIIVPISTDYDSDGDNAVRQKIAKITIPSDPASSLDDDWGLQFIEINNSSAGEKYVVESTSISDGVYDAARKKTKYTLTFDKTNNEIISALNSGKDVQFKVTFTEGNETYPVYFSVGYTRVDVFNNVPVYMFVGSMGELDHSVITVYGVTDSDETFRPYLTTTGGILPEPNPDDSDDGKVLVVNKHKWEMKKAVVDDALSDTSTNPVQNKVVKAALDGKASTAVASQTANGLMSAEDKTKLDSIDSVCYDIYAKIGAAYTHDSVYKYGCTVSHTFAEINTAVNAGKTPRVLLVDNIDNPSDTRIICPLLEYDTSRSEGGYYFDAPGLVGVSGSGRIYIDENGAMYTCSAGELPAVDANQDGKYLMIDGGMWTYRRPDVATTAEPGFMSAEDKAKLDVVEDGANKTVVDAALDDNSTNPVQNKAVKAALDTKAGTAVATASSNGLMSNDDKTKLDGIEYGATRVIVDDDMSDTSTNPVQNKAVKAALDRKLSTQGGEISGHLSVGLTVSAEGSVSVGRTSTDTGIHFEKAASDAGRISHGSDPMTGVSPIARLKVARPTADDDAATKAYVDGKAVAPILTSPVMIRKEGATDSAGVYLSTVGTGEKSAEIMLEDVNENSPVAIANLRTPTGAGADNYAATKGYVDNKVASSGSSDFVVNGTQDSGGTLTLDKTFTQIREAALGGKSVLMRINVGESYSYIPLINSNAHQCIFALTNSEPFKVLVTIVVVSPDNTVATAYKDAPAFNSDGTLHQAEMDYDPALPMHIATKKYVDDHLSGAPITIKLGTGNAATSTATFAEIKAALEAGKAPILDSVPGTSHWFALNWTLSGTDRLTIQYGTFNVDGGGLANFTFYNVAVSSTGITYASNQFTTE